MRRLTDDELQATTHALTGAGGESLRQLLFDLALGREASAEASIRERAVRHAEELGWVDAGALTQLGRLVADPIREYSFWLERDRRWPSEDTVRVLQRARFAHKRLLEAGSGGGCNLLSLHDVPGEFIGLEPMPVYVQMMPVLASMAGLPTPRAVEAGAEAIPFEDAHFDVVLCYSSHQYMDIDRALAEMSRVLRRGGQLIIVGNSFYPFAFETVGRFATTRSLGMLRYDGKSVLNTLSYQLLGRRVLSGGGGTTTGTPIYPSRRFMQRRLAALGLTVSAHDTVELPSGETVLVAVRR